MITNFWNWFYASVNNGVNMLNTIIHNNEVAPFIALLLAVVGIGVIIKFILAPLLGLGFIGASDKAESNYEKKRNAQFARMQRGLDRRKENN